MRSVAPPPPQPAVAAAADYACVCLCVCVRVALKLQMLELAHTHTGTDRQTHMRRVSFVHLLPPSSHSESGEKEREESVQERSEQNVCLYEYGFFESSVDVAVAVSVSV